jgi:chromosome segregation ATPase
LLLEARNVEIIGWQDRLSAISDQLAMHESASQEAVATAARNLELDRQQFVAELSLRQEELKNLERLLADRETQSHDLQHSFNTQLGELQNQLAGKQGLLEEHRQEIHRLTARSNDLQNQLAEKQRVLEARSQEITQLTTRSNDLQEEIARLQQANRQTVEETQTAARALEDSLNTRLRELEANVSEKSQLLHNRTAELENTQSETTALRQRIQQLELAGAEIEAAKNDADRMRAALENELNNAHRTLEQKDASFAQRDTEFRESTERLNTQLQILQTKLTQEHGVIADQKRELGNARSEIAALRNRLEELESSKASAEKTVQLTIERLRKDYRLELTALRADLDKQQLALAERQTTIRALEQELQGERQRLEAQVAEQQTLLHRGDAESQEQKLKISVLQEEIARSEFARGQTELLAAAQAKQIQEQVKLEVGALDAQLAEKEATVKALTDRARELESVFSAKIDDLHRQLSDKQLLLENRDNEMTELRTQINDLLEQIGRLERANGKALEQHRIAASDLKQRLHFQLNELQSQLADKHAALAARNGEIQLLELQVSQSELAVKQAETKAAGEIAQIGRQSESQLESLHAEIDWKLEDLQRREAAVYATEQNLRAEINALRAEVAEKRSLLESRNDELLQVKVEMDALQERIIYLESAATAAQLQATNTGETIADQDRAELEKLWNEVGQTELMLEQRQTAVNDQEGDVQAQINELRTELTDKQALLENPSKGFLLGETTLSESQKEKLNRLEQLVETIKADNEQTLVSPHNRRWRFSLGRKRRWKS